MNLTKHLSSAQINICQQEKEYYQRLGINKTLLQIAFEHNFLQKKENNNSYNIDIIKKYEIIITGEDDATYYIECKELLGKNRLKELEKSVGKNIVQKVIPVREFQDKFMLSYLIMML